MLMVEAEVVGKVCCRHKNLILSKTTFFCLSFLAVHQNSPGFYQVATYIYIWRTVTHSRCSFLSKTLSENITCQTILSVRRPHRVSQLTSKTFTTVLDCCVDMYSLILAHVQMRKCSINQRLFHYMFQRRQPFKSSIPGEVSVLNKDFI